MTQIKQIWGGATRFNIPVSVANGDQGSGATVNYYEDWGNDGKKFGSLMFNLEATTLKVYGSNDKDTVADASKEWDNITTLLFGIVSETVSGTWMIDTPLVFAKLKFEFVTTNATNSHSYKVGKSS